MATNRIYARVISKPFPSAQELLTLDDKFIGKWLSNLPPYFSQYAFVAPKFSLAHAVMMWRYRNLRIIMYRPFVIRIALHARDGRNAVSLDDYQAYERCLDEAKNTIVAISEYWTSNEHTRVAAWYAL